MKVASVQDIWRKLRRRSAPLRAGRLVRHIAVEYTGAKNIGAGKIELFSPINLICGENGAGKSSIIRLLADVLGAGELKPDFMPTVAVRYADAGNDVTERDLVRIRGLLNNGDGDSRLLFLDSASLVAQIRTRLEQDANPQDLINGAPFRDCLASEVAVISWCLGRDYEFVRIYEATEADGGVFPVFEVRSCQVNYGSLEMGTGELAFLIIFWTLSRALDGSVVLLEEPDFGLAPRSQSCLIDILAKFALEKDLFVVCSSHSQEVAARFVNSEIQLLTRLPDGKVDVRADPSRRDLVLRLQIQPTSHVLGFTEDRVALAMAGELLSEYLGRPGPLVLEVAPGVGGVRNALGGIPYVEDFARRAKFVGIFDGDYEGEDGGELQHPTLVLPGQKSPEKLVQTICARYGNEITAECLGKPSVDFERALGASQGLDAHDWLHSVARHLGFDPYELTRRIVRLWLERNPDDSVAFRRKFANLL